MGRARKNEAPSSGSSTEHTLSFLLVLLMVAIVWIEIVKSLWGK